MFRITFRRMDGTTDFGFASGNSESDARNNFLRDYDVRIIEVVRVS